MEQRKNNNGFTLIELLIVMVILGMLAALVGPKIFGKSDKAKLEAAKAQIGLFEAGLDLYRLDMGAYPTTSQGLKALRERPSAGDSKWDGPYLKKEIPTDPWGNDFIYRSPGEHGDFDILSYGRDNAPGGTGVDMDIVSWKGLEL
ncbi:MAG: type II secretion system protein GspG [Deltaproteobacteria bacterium]|nr:MAG: type II secretion system protein GspG [Deltaproteobacteria bacterium]